MKKKIFISLFLIALFICSFTTIVKAVIATTANTACVLSSSRCGDQTEVASSMLTANLAYQFLGFTSNNILDPSELVLLSNAMDKEVQLYFCHGNNTTIVFDDGGITTTSSGYKTITFPGSIFSTQIYCYSKDIIDWTGKKLITLASCHGASGYNTNTIGESQSYNLPSSTSIAGQLTSDGAEMVLAWYTDFSNVSGPDWLDNFHSTLYSSGGDVIEAIADADEAWYLWSNVRNHYLFHSQSSDFTLSTEQLESLSVKNKETSYIPKTNLLSSNEIRKYNISQIDEILASKIPNFNVKDYEISFSGGKSLEDSKEKNLETRQYVDYTYKIGDFVTNSAYTIVLDKNDKIIKIVDNTRKFDKKIITNKITANDFVISDNIKEYYTNRIKESVENPNSITEENFKFYYDLNSDKKYVSIEVKFDNSVDFNTDYFMYEI